MILLSINFVLLTMFKVREEQIHFWFCWCFPPTGPMHLISALSLWAGTLRARPEGVLQLPDSTKWRAWTYEHKHTGDTRHSGNHCPEMLEDVNYNNNNYYYRSQQNQGWNQQRPNYSERWSRTPRHPDLHRHGGLPRSTLRLWLQRQHYAQACKSDTKFPKGNIEEPLRPRRPFLNASGAVIYASAAKISFYIKRKKETFSFKNKITQIPEQSRHEPRGPTGGTGTSKCGPSQLRWSLQFKEVKIVDLSHRFWSKRMTQLQMADQTFWKVEGY